MGTIFVQNLINKIKNAKEKIEPNNQRLAIILLALIVTITILKGESFWTFNNFQSMLFQLPEFAILSFCLMLTFTTGGIDLSIVGIANLVSVIVALVLIKFAPPEAAINTQILVVFLSVLLGILLGALFGLLNGHLISRVGIPALLATLATQYLFSGIAKVLTKGKAASNIQPIFVSIFNSTFLRIITVPFIIFIIITILIYWIVKEHHLGFKITMLGSNKKTTEFSGINVNKIIKITYMLSGVLAAIAGIIMTARTNSAKSGFGFTYLTQAILTAVLGGTKNDGGYCTVFGMLLSILTIQILSSAVNMFPDVSNFYRDLIWGSVLLISIMLNYFQDKRKSIMI